MRKEKWEILRDATAERDRLYARILQLKAEMEEIEQEYQKAITKVVELDTLGY